MKRNHILLTSILIIAGILLVPHSTYACSPTADWPPSLQEAYTDTPIVFVGTVRSAEEIGGINGDVKITFTINTAYKGDITGVITLRTGANSALCGYAVTAFKAGDVWLMFAQENLSTSHLMLNQKFDSVEQARAIIETVGQPKVFEEEHNLDPKEDEDTQVHIEDNEDAINATTTITATSSVTASTTDIQEKKEKEQEKVSKSTTTKATSTDSTSWKRVAVHVVEAITGFIDMLISKLF